MSDRKHARRKSAVLWMGRGMLEKIPVGLVFSTNGPYSAVASAMLNGALLAIDEVNTGKDYGFVLEPNFFDPAGKLAGYRGACERMLKHEEVHHVIGCYTSSSRKEVIPCFEKYDGLLWYPSHYEGFETSSNVIYTGAAPNQHLVPLAKHMMKAHGKRAFCIGSNYIWAWENNRILREILTANGGDVLYGGLKGVEKESLRVSPDGFLAQITRAGVCRVEIVQRGVRACIKL